MRRVLVVVATLAVIAGAAYVYARLLAGGPVAVVPGGALSGEVLVPPQDWSFASDFAYIDVETRAGVLPHSRTEWFMVHDGRIHLLLPSLFGFEEEMKALLDADPNVRVRIQGRDEVYEQRAVEVVAPDDLDALLGPMIRRQFAMEVSGVRQVAESGVSIWIYRLDDRGAAP